MSLEVRGKKMYARKRVSKILVLLPVFKFIHNESGQERGSVVIIIIKKMGVTAHACDLSIQEGKAGDCCKLKASLESIIRAPGWSGL